MRILAIEDDELLAQTVADGLAKYHYSVDVAADGQVGWQFAIAAHYDLILLDVMLPKLDGISLCRQLRQEGYQMPILLLTAKDSQTDKIMGLDAGADDYVVKPFEFNELTARIRALLRRGSSSSPVLEWGGLRLDPTSCEASYEGQMLTLTSTEHNLLELFLRNGQRVFSRRAIVEHLWAFEDSPEAATIKSHIKNLRQKLKATGAPPDLIETVYGLGYRLKPLPDKPDNPDGQATTVPDELDASAQQVMQAVIQNRERFMTRLGERLSILERAAEAIATETIDPELHHQAIQAAHKLAGALETFGFPTGSRIAAIIEDLLQVSSLTYGQTQQLLHLVTALGLENFNTSRVNPTFAD